MKNPLICSLFVGAFALSGCVPGVRTPEEAGQRTAVGYLEAAASRRLTTEQRAVLYLEAAHGISSQLDSGPSSAEIYNQAVANLTILLRGADDGRLWDRPVTLSSGGTVYQLRYGSGSREGRWDPGYFTAFKAAGDVDLKTIEHRNSQTGFGAALVGIRKTNPPELFSTPIGITAPVTAVLNFNGRVATLSLIDPTVITRAPVAGRSRTLEADFSAPLAAYRHKSELREGLMGAIQGAKYMEITGLYMLQPYDPQRIPLIFVHGLISTPRMWRNVINELEMDPVLRRRYQCWVFAYPTGNPPMYSALRLREELAKVHQRFPDSKPMVLVGHSMGGLLSRMQVTTLDRPSWDVIGEQDATRFFSQVKPGDLTERCTLFSANPRVGRAVFICTPHRGSDMAIGTIGDLAMRMISLPVDIAATVANSVGNSISIVTGDPNRMPNSIDGLSPDNPGLKALDSRPIEAPHHSIVGDRGKGDSPESSDGVVEYRSSHLESAESEKIVPGPHGAYDLPESIAELRRILLLHLQSS